MSVLSDVGSVEGLAYHRAWDTLFWTSSTTSTITRQTLDQTRVGAFERQAVVTLSEEDHPHVLALDECQKSVSNPSLIHCLSSLANFSFCHNISVLICFHVDIRSGNLSFIATSGHHPADEL